MNVIKTYCDICGEEITDRNNPALGTTGSRMKVSILAKDRKSEFHLEVMTASSSPVGAAPAWNKGDICKYCIIEAIDRLDDRPKQALR